MSDLRRALVQYLLASFQHTHIPQKIKFVEIEFRFGVFVVLVPKNDSVVAELDVSPFDFVTGELQQPNKAAFRREPVNLQQVRGEVELSAIAYNEFVYEIPEAMYVAAYRILSSAPGYRVTSVEHLVDQNYASGFRITRTINDNQRRASNGRGNNYLDHLDRYPVKEAMVKSRLRRADVKSADFIDWRMSVAVEDTSVQHTTETRFTVRDKQRRAVYFPGNKFRLDFTEVVYTETGACEYQMELEYLPKFEAAPDERTVRQLIDEALDTIRCVQQAMKNEKNAPAELAQLLQLLYAPAAAAAATQPNTAAVPYDEENDDFDLEDEDYMNDEDEDDA